MKPIVRKAKHGDEEGIHLAHMESIKTVCKKDYSEEQLNAWGGRPYHFEQKRNLIDHHHVWVVEDSGKIEGYGLLFIDSDQEKAEIGALYLTNKVLGRGLGKEIVSKIKKKTKDLGLSEIILSSTKTAKKFYESQGFFQYAEDDCCLIGGVEIEGHPMKLTLS